jgi:hypothetical protein
MNTILDMRECGFPGPKWPRVDADLQASPQPLNSIVAALAIWHIRAMTLAQDRIHLGQLAWLGFNASLIDLKPKTASKAHEFY